MSRQDGFAVMDVSTSILDDQKFRKLQRLHPEAVAAGVTGYLSVLAESWKAGRRVSIEDAWPAILAPEEATVAALKSVGLLDRRGFLPARPWTKWFEIASKRREAARARWDRYNAKRDAASTNDDVAQTSLPRGNHVSTATSVPTVPSVSSKEETRDGTRATPRQAVHRWLTDHGIALPTGWANGTLNELVKVFGAEAVVETWEGTPGLRTITQHVRHAERTLAPDAPAPKGTTQPKGYQPTPQEVEDAFS